MTEDTTREQQHITREELAETLKTALDQRDEQLIKRVGEMIRASVDDEADQRQADIKSVRDDIRAVDKKMSGIDTKMSIMNTSLDSVQKTLERVTGVLDSIQTVITNVSSGQREQARRMETIETRQEKNSEEIRNDIELLTSNQAAITNKADITYRAIFGVPGESGPVSLYESIATLQAELTRRIGDVLASSEGNRRSIDALTAREDARSAEEQRQRVKWQARRQAIVGAVKIVAKSRLGLAAGLAGLGAMLLAVAPEVGQLFEQFIQMME